MVAGVYGGTEEVESCVKEYSVPNLAVTVYSGAEADACAVYSAPSTAVETWDHVA